MITLIAEIETFIQFLIGKTSGQPAGQEAFVVLQLARTSLRDFNESRLLRGWSKTTLKTSAHSWQFFTWDFNLQRTVSNFTPSSYQQHGSSIAPYAGPQFGPLEKDITEKIASGVARLMFDILDSVFKTYIVWIQFARFDRSTNRKPALIRAIARWMQWRALAQLMQLLGYAYHTLMTNSSKRTQTNYRNQVDWIFELT